MSEYTHLVIPKKLYEADTTSVGYGVNEWEVVGINYYDGVIQEYTIKTKTFKTSIRANKIGKSFFLAYEEAEAALKGGQDDV